VEFETAVMQVDFAEIEAVKHSAAKWRKKNMNRATKTS
jgi:hypothetical protein